MMITKLTLRLQSQQSERKRQFSPPLACATTAEKSLKIYVQECNSEQGVSGHQFSHSPPLASTPPPPSNLLKVHDGLGSMDVINVTHLPPKNARKVPSHAHSLVMSVRYWLFPGHRGCCRVGGEHTFLNRQRRR